MYLRKYFPGRPMSTQRALPSWLKSWDSQEHLGLALKTLKKREAIRRRARQNTRDQYDSPVPTNNLHHPVQSQQRINQEEQRREEHYSVSIAHHPDNIGHNRYADVEPYNRTRATVGGSHCTSGRGEGEGCGEDAEGRYLNASWVLERFGGKWWIAAQAPLPVSAHAFLSLILRPNLRPPKSNSHLPYRTRIRTVVQLTQNFEHGFIKADPYFPERVGESWTIPPEPGCSAPPLGVKLLNSEYISSAHGVRSTVLVASPDDPQGVTFTHLLYTRWPDHGVPDAQNQRSLLAFIKLVDETNRNQLNTSDPHPETLDPDPPMIVGCSAGIGRTGSFIALSSLLRDCGILLPPATPTPSDVLDISPMGPLPGELAGDKVVQEIDSLREQRPGMVQKDEQAILIYQMLAGQFSS
ncbi:hypothetical protein AX16_000425 [Volvariella volvacea WC 439]|nr:hypothetical protein AX16_000425 [Volvariella volvacea WC 439]